MVPAPLQPLGVTGFGTRPPGAGRNTLQASKLQAKKKKTLSVSKDYLEKQKQWNKTSGCLVSLKQPIPLAKRTELSAYLKGKEKKNKTKHEKRTKSENI